VGAGGKAGKTQGKRRAKNRSLSKRSWFALHLCELLADLQECGSILRGPPNSDRSRVFNPWAERDTF
jgi:hypothetical protein